MPAQVRGMAPYSSMSATHGHPGVVPPCTIAGSLLSLTAQSSLPSPLLELPERGGGSPPSPRHPRGPYAGRAAAPLPLYIAPCFRPTMLLPLMREKMRWSFLPAQRQPSPPASRRGVLVEGVLLNALHLKCAGTIPAEGPLKVSTQYVPWSAMTGLSSRKRTNYAWKAWRLSKHATMDAPMATLKSWEAGAVR